jgi:chemotaxis protein methyltransferase CheR
MSTNDELRAFLREKTGISVSEAKDYLLRTRLEPVANSAGVTLDELVKLLRTRTDVQRAVIDAMTTNETSFFRDLTLWKCLESAVLPSLKGIRPVNVWSAACSTGQEAYSLAMLSREIGVNVRITGSDISGSVVEKARKGVYTRLEVNRGLSARRLLDNFTQQVGDEWCVNDAVRASCMFQEANLLNSQLGALYDLVLLRNVLIYFEDETRQRVFQNVAGAVRSGGYLVLGASEGLLNIPSGFHRSVQDGVTLWQRD